MRVRSGFGGAVLALLLLAGCAPAPAAVDDGETPAPETDPTPSASPGDETPAVREFRMPRQCTELLTAETAARFADEGRDLLGGPGGLYGEDYFVDPTPEERAGGITCVWGDEEQPATTVIVSVAPISTANRSGIVRQLIDSGLIESELDGALSYARLGDDVSSPGELHVIRSESWVSVIEAVGGEDRFAEATALVDEVTARVYVEG